MGDQDPAALLADVDKALKWCGFLLGSMLFILLIDLLLVRSIGRQAVAISQKSAMVTRMLDTIRADLTGGAGGGRQGMAKTAGRGGDPGVGGGDGVDGTPPGAAGAAAAPGPVKAKAPRRSAGTSERTSGDGPGAQGDTGG